MTTMIATNTEIQFDSQSSYHITQVPHFSCCYNQHAAIVNTLTMYSEYSLMHHNYGLRENIFEKCGILMCLVNKLGNCGLLKGFTDNTMGN